MSEQTGAYRTQREALCGDVWGQAGPRTHTCVCPGPTGHPVGAAHAPLITHWCPCGNWWPQPVDNVPTTERGAP